MPSERGSQPSPAPGSEKPSTNDSGKKKKRPRIRDRPRNKKNAVSAEPPAEQSEVGVAEAAPKDCPTESKSRTSSQAESTSQSSTKSAAKPPMSAPGKTATAEAKTAADYAAGKTREEIMAEREAKKLAKQAKKVKTGGGAEVKVANDTAATPAAEPPASGGSGTTEKSREQIKAEREAKKLSKQSAKAAKAGDVSTAEALALQLAEVQVTSSLPSQADHAAANNFNYAKAERRAIMEAKRAEKAEQQRVSQGKTTATQAKTASQAKTAAQAKTTASSKPPSKATVTAPTPAAAAAPPAAPIPRVCKVKLFNHLESAKSDASLFVNHALLHPSIARLGEQYAKRTIVGSNARCIGFLNALKMVIQDFETPPKTEFGRSLEHSITTCVDHLQQCRPLAVSVSNAYKHIRHVLTQLPKDLPESELKENMCHFIDTYIENQIEKAAQAISSSMQEKITDGDVILTFGCSSLISYICEEARRRGVDFRVIVVDSRPFCEGQELLRRLTAKEIPCTYVLINALSFVMPEATKVVLGAHALLSNGYVMARTGTAQVALVARSFNVPVLVCCETHKFSERFQTDAIVYNELGNPNDLITDNKCCLSNWQAKPRMSPLNLMYDITPPELVTAVVTEVSILPCTSVPVILRIKPTEIGYYS